MLELLSASRQEVFYESALTIVAANTYPQALGGAAAAYQAHRAAGNSRLLGILRGSNAPAAGFPRIRFWPSPGDVTGLTALATYPLTVDPNNANVYQIDMALYSPYFTIEWTHGATDGTLSGVVWVLPDGGSSDAATTTGDVPPPYAYTALGYEQLTVAAVSIGLASIPAAARYVSLTVETASIRYRDDGTAPTAAVGMPLLASQSVFYQGTAAAIAAIRFIRQTATSATVNALYYS